MKKIGLCFLCFLLCSCSPKVLEKSTYFFPVMNDSRGDMVLALNTDTRLVTVDSSKENDMRSKAWELIQKYHRLADSHHFYRDGNGQLLSNTALLNESYAQEKELPVAEELIQMLDESFRLAEITRGYFNPTSGTLSSLWEPYFKSTDSYSEGPLHEDVEACSRCIVKVEDLRKTIELNKERNTVTFHSYPACPHKVKIDLGAFSKGYVADRIYEALLPYKSSFLFDAGTSSIIAYVQEGEDIHWNVGVRNPDDESVLLAVSLNNGAISTSGDNQRYFFETNDDGSFTRRHHILNPYSGYPENIYRGITLVAAKQAAAIDALSTALYNIADFSQQQEILRAIQKQYGIHVERALLRQGKNGIAVEMDRSLQTKLLKGVGEGIESTLISENGDE